ncbi:MAG: DUF4405 domain-containing protein [Chloroflexota bacterium]|nr:DUF4405 domain-containing protein [Chloroflexota bacterium]
MATTSRKRQLSTTTKLNWLLDFILFLGAVAAAVTGIYFLFFVSGGYQAGRNPLYGVTLLFERATWDLLHTWGGVLMISAALAHLAIHLDWVRMIGRKIVFAVRGDGRGLSRGAKINIAVNAVIAISFFLVAISGVVFLFAPTGGYQGGANPGWEIQFLFGRATWDMIHTWSGVTLIVAGIVHLSIHWRWVTKVAGRMLPVRDERISAPSVVNRV